MAEGGGERFVDEGAGPEGQVPRWSGRLGGRKYDDATGMEILRRVRAGETLAQVCRDPAMPRYDYVIYWARRRKAFREDLDAARLAAGGSLWSTPVRFCPETCETILKRLCAGESIGEICRDESLPTASTVYRWMREKPEWREAVATAREMLGDRLVDEALAICRGATRETAYVAHVQLTHLRWLSGKLAPERYGALKAVEPERWGEEPDERDGAPRGRIMVERSFWLEMREDGARRVRASYYDPDKNQLVDEPPNQDWVPPLPGMAMGRLSQDVKELARLLRIANAKLAMAGLPEIHPQRRGGEAPG
jgi:hypothetical protein